MNIMFATHENHQKWLYDSSDWVLVRKDLNAAEVIAYFEKGDKDFPIEYLYKPCFEAEDAQYRLEIMSEIFENDGLYNKLSDCIAELKQLRRFLVDFREEKHEVQKNYRYLLAFCTYAKLAEKLKAVLESAKSEGLKKIYHYCGAIMLDDTFNSGREAAIPLADEIFNVLNKTGLVFNPHEKTFLAAEGEGDTIKTGDTAQLLSEIADIYGITMKDTFSVVDPMPLSYVEEQVLLMLMENNPEMFENLKIFADTYGGVLKDMKIFAGLLPQFVFFVNYINFINLMKSYGLNACTPKFGKDYSAFDCASISLAVKFYYESLNIGEIVRNNINLPGGGKFILSGPNQGGKTIYLKQLGLTAYLAKCGCYVLCESCTVPFYDKILTHFMQKEVLGKSRLVEEIERIENIMPEITRDSLVLLNESFTSTRRKDSVDISLHYLKKFDEAGCSVGFVSHFYELPELDKSIISLRSEVGDNGTRTYSIFEKQGDGLAYALDISRACGTTYEQLVEIVKLN